MIKTIETKNSSNQKITVKLTRFQTIVTYIIAFSLMIIFIALAIKAVRWAI
jgi:hypothetical protein